ncbi:hypothetical protein GGS20DRAFT_341766 [Poronia punctata]|nr:hypothetical protein GGS20DRAFT_341766 [Poronia punctata]
MAPNNQAPMEARETRYPNGRLPAATSSPMPPRSTTASALQRQHQQQQQQRQRNDGQFPSLNSMFQREYQLIILDSWVEVSSNPSSSSVSSVGEEIDTTGLQVRSSYGARRRRLHPQSYAHLHPNRADPSAARSGWTLAQTSYAGSSQEEYDESESEEDNPLTSSTEIAATVDPSRQTPLRQVFSSQVVDTDSSDDDDENATALGRRPSQPFRPQPNAFSHPPSHLTHRHSTSSAIPQHVSRPPFHQRSHTRVERHSPNFMSPDYHDNDAALRASLTTLLSCAAAARSLPKDGEKELSGRTGTINNSQPVALRFAPESELMAPSPPATVSRGSSHPDKSCEPPTSREPMTGDKIKRAATPTSGAKSTRATKKKRTVQSEDSLISPTLLTWVVSAGVVVLVSVVGFGAGYVIGREVGRQETLNGLGSGNLTAATEGGKCGREVIRSSGGTLRRFRWGGGMGRGLVA